MSNKSSLQAERAFEDGGNLGVGIVVIFVKHCVGMVISVV